MKKRLFIFLLFSTLLIFGCNLPGLLASRSQPPTPTVDATIIMLMTEVGVLKTQVAVKEKDFEEQQTAVHNAIGTATQVAINKLATENFMPTWTFTPSPTFGPSPTPSPINTLVPTSTQDKETRIFIFDDEKEIRDEVVQELQSTYGDIYSSNSCKDTGVYDVAIIDGAPGGPECIMAVLKKNPETCIVGYARNQIDEENLGAAAADTKYYFVYKPSPEGVAEAVARCQN